MAVETGALLGSRAQLFLGWHRAGFVGKIIGKFMMAFPHRKKFTGGYQFAIENGWKWPIFIVDPIWSNTKPKVTVDFPSLSLSLYLSIVAISKSLAKGQRRAIGPMPGTFLCQSASTSASDFMLSSFKKKGWLFRSATHQSWEIYEIAIVEWHFSWWSLKCFFPPVGLSENKTPNIQWFIIILHAPIKIRFVVSPFGG